MVVTVFIPDLRRYYAGILIRVRRGGHCRIQVRPDIFIIIKSQGLSLTGPERTFSIMVIEEDL